MSVRDPYGQADPNEGQFYGFKSMLLTMIEESKRNLARLERLIHRQDEIINDTTRAAVYRELVADIRKDAGDAAYACSNEDCPVKPATPAVIDMDAALRAWNTRTETKQETP